MTNRAHNFSAGPAVLPLSVLKTAQQEMLSLHGSGMSIVEISHRSLYFSQIIEQAETRLRALLQIPADYHVLFLQGGASLQFSMIPMNFLASDQSMAFVDSGSWAKKAFLEAQKVGSTTQIWSDKAQNYQRMPSTSELSTSSDYIHLTSNETIQGIALQSDYKLDKPVICDMSSDILSRPVDVNQYDLIYAGAQKNMGPSGVTLVILKDQFLKKHQQTSASQLGSMLNYTTHIENKSMYNTPPVFSIYLLNLVMGWLEEQGGLSGIHQRNQNQAQQVYAVVDQSQGFYQGHAQIESRSLMNITFTIPGADQALFLKQAEAKGLHNLKGHRSVGGIRASLYNACPQESVDALCAFMQDFKRNQS